MTDSAWQHHEREQRKREAVLTLEQKLLWLDDMIMTATMLGWKMPKRIATGAAMDKPAPTSDNAHSNTWCINEKL